MSRLPAFSRFALFLLALVLALPGSAWAQAEKENRKHHISLTIGYQKYLGDNLKDEALGIDLTNAGLGNVAYRFSLKPNLDLCLDTRGAVSRDEIGGVDVNLLASYFGPGIRLISPAVGTRPYIQANVYTVSEEVELEQGGITISESDNGIGFGLAAGVDIRASNLISIPIEATFLYAEPDDVLRGLGGAVGITFNFGQLD